MPTLDQFIDDNSLEEASYAEQLSAYNEFVADHFSWLDTNFVID